MEQSQSHEVADLELDSLTNNTPITLHVHCNVELKQRCDIATTLPLCNKVTYTDVNPRFGLTNDASVTLENLFSAKHDNTKMRDRINIFEA